MTPSASRAESTSQLAAEPASNPPVDRLAMVYDADGGLVGEARYVVGHLLGRTECALCDITHGPVRRKADFDALVDTLDIPVDVVHRNEQDPAVASVTAGHLPCVAAQQDGEWSVLLDADAPQACDGDVGRLGERLRTALAAGTQT